MDLKRSIRLLTLVPSKVPVGRLIYTPGLGFTQVSPKAIRLQLVSKAVALSCLLLQGCSFWNPSQTLSCASSALGYLVSWASGLTRLATGPPGVTLQFTTRVGPPQLARCFHVVGLPREYAPNSFRQI
jgi:hypothetical protein